MSFTWWIPLGIYRVSTMPAHMYKICLQQKWQFQIFLVICLCTPGKGTPILAAVYMQSLLCIMQNTTKLYKLAKAW
jgi:hypothetical protein